MPLPCSSKAIDQQKFDAINDSGSCYRVGQPARLTGCHVPRRSPIALSFAQEVVKKRPSNRSPPSLSIQLCQQWPLQSIRSKISASSAEIFKNHQIV